MITLFIVRLAIGYFVSRRQIGTVIESWEGTDETSVTRAAFNRVDELNNEIACRQATLRLSV